MLFFLQGSWWGPARCTTVPVIPIIPWIPAVGGPTSIQIGQSESEFGVFAYYDAMDVYITCFFSNMYIVYNIYIYIYIYIHIHIKVLARVPVVSLVVTVFSTFTLAVPSRFAFRLVILCLNHRAFGYRGQLRCCSLLCHRIPALFICWFGSQPSQFPGYFPYLQSAWFSTLTSTSILHLRRVFGHCHNRRGFFGPTVFLELNLFFWISWGISSTLRMLFFLSVVALLLHDSGLSQKATAPCSGTGPLSLVAVPTGFDWTGSLFELAPVDLQDSLHPPQQRSWTSPACEAPPENSYELPGQRSLEVWPLQEIDQTYPALLPQLWLLVGRCCRSKICAPSSHSSLGSKLDLGFMGGHSSPQTQDSETEKLICQATWQGSRQGKGTDQNQGQVGWGRTWTTFTFPFSDTEFDGSHSTIALPCDSVDSTNCGSTRCPCGSRSRSYCCDPTCISRFHGYAQRGPRCTGPFGTGCEQAGDTRPPSCNSKPRTCSESSSRTGGIARKTSPALVPASSGVIEDVERPDGWLRYPTRGVSHCDPEGQSGYEPGTSQHTDPQRQGCWKTTPRSCDGSQARRPGCPWRPRPRGTCSTKAIAQPGGPMCPQSLRKEHCHDSRGTQRSRGDCGRFRRRGSIWQQTVSLYLAISCQRHCYTGFGSWHWSECTSGDQEAWRWQVKLGSAPSCLRNAERLPSYRGHVRFTGVEAYPSVCDRLGAACPVIRPYGDLFSTIDPSHWSLSEDLAPVDFLLPLGAQRYATLHRWTCLMADISDNISKEVLCTYLKPSNCSISALHSPSVDLTDIVADDDSDVGLCIPDYSLGKENNDAANRVLSPFCHLPHVSDRWCASDNIGVQSRLQPFGEVFDLKSTPLTIASLDTLVDLSSPRADADSKVRSCIWLNPTFNHLDQPLMTVLGPKSPTYGLWRSVQMLALLMHLMMMFRSWENPNMLNGVFPLAFVALWLTAFSRASLLMMRQPSPS